jgi:hypothetical protein
MPAAKLKKKPGAARFDSCAGPPMRAALRSALAALLLAAGAHTSGRAPVPEPFAAPGAASPGTVPCWRASAPCPLALALPDPRPAPVREPTPAGPAGGDGSGTQRTQPPGPRPDGGHAAAVAGPSPSDRRHTPAFSEPLRRARTGHDDHATALPPPHA